jgi:DNA mismatch endonuclease (patch repair protein)
MMFWCGFIRETEEYIQVDTVSKETRSRIMSAIRSKHTKPEMVVRSTLHRMGYRFGLHHKKLPGTPDVVLNRMKAVVDVRGCFFHKHTGCRHFNMPKSNVAFWRDKFRRNKARDRRNCRLLRAMGWRVIVIWECQTKNEGSLRRKLTREMDKIT